ncbi:MAG: hypothetical protein AAF802_18205 [Planctomycetota bacterium]
MNQRFHLIEFHEQPWVPQLLREGVTDYLRFVTEIAGHYKAVAPLVTTLLEEQPEKQIVDLGSGAGGGWRKLHPMLEDSLREPVRITLTDRNPNLAAFESGFESFSGRISYRAEPVDARDVPEDLKGLRTMFNIFHHLRPDDARSVIADADAKNQPLLIVEVLEKSFIQAVLILILAPIFALILTPFIRPFRVSRIVLTYLIPALPLMIAWDGFVSVLRLYGPPQMNQLCDGLDGLTWESGKLKNGSITMLYLMGSSRTR